MIYIRKNKERGLTKTDWLHSQHSFSFGDYYDPGFMGFGPLRVINEDVVAPAAGFNSHPHHDMEIISYVIEGELNHKDSMGTGSTIKVGEIQKMSAGTGVLHSEFNPSNQQPVHFLQIWIIPEKQSLASSYEQQQLPKHKNSLNLIGSNEPSNNMITIHQAVKLYSAFLEVNQVINHEIPHGYGAWLQLIKGELIVNDQIINAGDGCAIVKENQIQIKASKPSEFLFFDLKM